MSTYPEGSLPHSALRWQVNEFPSVGSFRVPSLCFWVLPKKGRLVEESMSFASGSVNCRLLALGLNNSVRAFRWGSKRGGRALYPRGLITGIKKIASKRVIAAHFDQKKFSFTGKHQNIKLVKPGKLDRGLHPGKGLITR